MNNNIQLNRFEEGRTFSLNVTVQCPRIITRLIPTLSKLPRRDSLEYELSRYIHDFSYQELLPYIDDSWIEQTCRTMMNNPLIDSIFLSKKEVLRIHDFRMVERNCVLRLTIVVECEVSYKTMEKIHRKELQERVETLELSFRTAGCLQRAGIEYIYELVTWTPEDLLRTKHFGRKSLNEIKELLNEKGLSLKSSGGAR